MSLLMWEFTLLAFCQIGEDRTVTREGSVSEIPAIVATMRKHLEKFLNDPIDQCNTQAIFTVHFACDALQISHTLLVSVTGFVLAPQLDDDGTDYLHRFADVLPKKDDIVSIAGKLKLKHVIAGSGETLMLGVTRKASKEATLNGLLDEVQTGVRSYATDLLAHLDSRFPPDSLDTLSAFGLFDLKSEKWAAFLQSPDKAFGELEIKALAKHFGCPKPGPSSTPTTSCPQHLAQLAVCRSLSRLFLS